MFLRSKRVCQDLSLALDHLYDENFVIREWTQMDASMEVRSLVFEGKLSGISQYYYQEMFPDLVEG